MIADSFAVNILAAVVVVVPLWRIFTRAGLHPALALLVFLPLFGGAAVLLVLALSRWPRTEGLK